MKNLLKTMFNTTLFFFFVGFTLQAQENNSSTAYKGATLLDGTGKKIENSVIIIKEGRIIKVGKEDMEITSGTEIVDVSGKYITPGLIDAHVHYDGTGWVDAHPFGYDVSDRFPYAEVNSDLRQNPERFHQSYLCSGVTAVFDLGGPTWTLDVRDDAKGSKKTPHYLAAGPLLTTIPHLIEDPAARGLNMHMKDEETVRRGVQMLSWLGSDAVKLWGLEMAEDREAIRKLLRVAAEEAKKANLPIIVHAQSLESAKDALRDGNASMLVHGLPHKTVDEEFLELARQNDVLYVPTIGAAKTFLAALSPVGSSHAELHFPEQEIPLECVDRVTRKKLLLTDSLPPRKTDYEAMRAHVLSDHQTNLKNLKRIHEAGIKVAMGTDAGNALIVHGPAIYPEMQAMVEAGLTPMEVLVCATQNGARAMGRLNDFGTLEKGKIADLLILENDPSRDILNFKTVTHVMRGGLLKKVAEICCQQE